MLRDDEPNHGRSEKTRVATAELHDHVFATTHWSLLPRAGDQADSQAASALEQLCRTYWYPLYAYVRRQGRGPEEAQDLTQEFFARLLARRSLSQVSREKGRFRSFLLASMNHFLADAWDHAHRQKRGGGTRVIPLDALEAEELGLSDDAVRATISRMRKRCRELAREEIAHTLASISDVEDEYRALLAALRI